MYLERTKERLESMAEFTPEKKQRMLWALRELTDSGFFSDIKGSATSGHLALTYEGITAEKMLESAAKYRAITGLLDEVETLLIESEELK